MDGSNANDLEAEGNRSTDAAPVRNRGGRPKGLPKTGGRRKGVPSAAGREARAFLAANSNYLEVLARVCQGKPVRTIGPGGKRAWHYPTWADVRWAVELVASKCVPTMAAAELSGPDGAPIQTEHRELSDLETARRLAFVLSKGAREAERNGGGDGDADAHLAAVVDCGEEQRAEHMRRAFRASGFQDPVALARVLPVVAPEPPSDGWATQADDGAVLVLHHGKQRFRAASQSIAEAFIETERHREREQERIRQFTEAAMRGRNEERT